jgi:2-iminobutanoate/2-iminopropanoate deaminase
MENIMKEMINTSNAPGAIGPYSQAIKAGDFIYVSGQIPIDPGTGEFAGNDITTQSEQSLKNVQAILKEAGCTMDQVVKSTVLLDDMKDFAAMNEVYGKFFSQPYPARAAFAVKTLPKNALVEIEVVAYKG